jgi:uncharacterized protein YvpB
MEGIALKKVRVLMVACTVLLGLGIHQAHDVVATTGTDDTTAKADVTRNSTTGDDTRTSVSSSSSRQSATEPVSQGEDRSAQDKVPASAPTKTQTTTATVATPNSGSTQAGTKTAKTTTDSQSPITTSASSVNVSQGPWITTDEYVTVSSANYTLFGDFNWKVKQSSRALGNQILHATGQYHHTNGSTYLSLSNAQGVWQGYLNAKAVKILAGPQGDWKKATGYVTITKTTPLYRNFSGVANGNLAPGHTYHVSGTYHWFDGTVYWSLYDQNNQWVGYVNAALVNKVAAPQGSWQPLSNYGRTTGHYAVWQSFSFSKQTKVPSGTAILVKGQYWYANGSTYVSAYDLKGHWLGYLNARGYSAVSTPQGTVQADSGYVTVTHRYSSYSSFNWKQLHASAELYHRTFQSRGKYVHINGSTYLSLYDSQGKWWGYINKNAADRANDAKGVWFSASGHTSFANRNINTYSDLGQTIKTQGAQLFEHTYRITGAYHAFDGMTWYSLYTNKKVWIGYVRANDIQLTAAQGRKFAYSNYLTTTKKSVTIWSSFGFHHGLSTSASAYQQTYRINGVYHHFNGSSYYSLFKDNGQWVGYINATGGSETTAAQGVWLSHKGNVTLSVKGYPIWKGFFSNQVGTTSMSTYFDNTYNATGMYRHANGSLYYSLYSGKTWIGYVNAAATLQKYRVIKVPNYNQYKNGAPVGCEGVSLYQALRAKGYASKYSLHAFLNTIPKASSPYNGFVGSPFVADNKTYTAIFAEPLAKWGQQFGQAVNISNSSVSTLEKEILAGNPVVAYVTEHFASIRWGNWAFGRVPNNNHAVTIAGVDLIKKRLYLSDPIDGQYWITENKFAKIYNQRKMAVVVR